MGNKSVAEKARIKPGTRVGLLNPVGDVVAGLGLPEDVSFVEPASADLVFLFVRNRADLDTLVEPAVAELAPTATLWVFYRKGARSGGLDMSRDDVWAVAERLDLRPLGLISVDETWSAFRLRRASP